MTEPVLRILSVYEALDGEANAFHQGSWTVFVRTAGCAVGCLWCDTMYSWSPKRGKDYTISSLVGLIALTGKARKITLTGGEPLEQPVDAIASLLHEMVLRGYQVTIETAGTEPVAWLKSYHPNVALVLDYKPPSAKIDRPMLVDNYKELDARHVVKFIVSNEEDYQQMIIAARMMRGKYCSNARFVMSPLNTVGKHHSVCTLEEWVDKMKHDELSSLGIGLNLQLHKIIYPKDAREEEGGGVDYTGVHKEQL